MPQIAGDIRGADASAAQDWDNDSDVRAGAAAGEEGALPHERRESGARRRAAAVAVMTFRLELP